MAFHRDLLGEIQDRLLKAMVVNARVRTHQAENAGVVHESKKSRGVGHRFVGLVKKVQDWNLQYFRDPLQPSGRDAIGSLLVFLHLLERQPQLVREFHLGHMPCKPASPDATPHLDIVCISPLGHHEPPTVRASDEPDTNEAYTCETT